MTRTRINLTTAALGLLVGISLVACGTPAPATETVTLTPAASSGSMLDEALEGAGSDSSDILPSADAAPGLRDGALNDAVAVRGTDNSPVDALMSVAAVDVLDFLNTHGEEVGGLTLESWGGTGIQNGMCLTTPTGVVGVCPSIDSMVWNRAKTQAVVTEHGDLAAAYMAAQALGILVGERNGDASPLTTSACVVGAYAAYVASNESYRFASDPASSAAAMRGVIGSVSNVDVNSFIDTATSALNGYMTGSPSPCFN